MGFQTVNEIWTRFPYVGSTMFGTRAWPRREWPRRIAQGNKIARARIQEACRERQPAYR